MIMLAATQAARWMKSPNEMDWQELNALARFLKDHPRSNITPVPAEVTEAVDEELEEEWMKQLTAFAATLRPSHARGASSAAEVRQAFYQFCGGSVPRKEVGLRMARRGFAEESVNVYNGVVRSKRRAYRFRFPDGVAFVALRAGCTGSS